MPRAIRRATDIVWIYIESNGFMMEVPPSAEAQPNHWLRIAVLGVDVLLFSATSILLP